MAGAVYLVTGCWDRLRAGSLDRAVWAAMLLAGVAIAIKTTVVFEAVFLGLSVVATLGRAGMPARHRGRVALGLALTGLLPSLVIATGYAALGHLPEFWHAMVLSNLHKQPLSPRIAEINLLLSCVRGAALLAVVGWSATCCIVDARVRWFVLGWLAAAIIGYAAVPRFVFHYALPLLVPACTICAFGFGRGMRGMAAFAGVIAFALLWFDPFGFAQTDRSIGAMDQLARLAREHDGGGGLLVFAGPASLYAQTGKRPLSALAFPQHLSDAAERDVSHIGTIAEIRRIVARGPGVVVMAGNGYPLDPVTTGIVADYTRNSCKFFQTVRAYQFGAGSDITVSGDCAKRRLWKSPIG